jgi:hypothetical protein
VLKYANLCRMATGRLLVPESWLRLQDQEILSASVTQKQTLALGTGEPGCASESAVLQQVQVPFPGFALRNRKRDYSAG